MAKSPYKFKTINTGLENDTMDDVLELVKSKSNGAVKILVTVTVQSEDGVYHHEAKSDGPWSLDGFAAEGNTEAAEELFSTIENSIGMRVARGVYGDSAVIGIGPETSFILKGDMSRGRTK